MGCYVQNPITARQNMSRNEPFLPHRYDKLTENGAKTIFITSKNNKRARDQIKTPARASANANSKQLSFSPSLSSILNQKKSQKLNNNSKKPTHYYHKYNSKSVEETQLAPTDLSLGDTAGSRRRRSSSYWFNTNINNSERGFSSETVVEDYFDPLLAQDIEAGPIKVSYQESSTVKIFDALKDLDFVTEYHVSDVKEFYVPKYDIKLHRRNTRKPRTAVRNIEMESIAGSETERYDNKDNSNVKIEGDKEDKIDSSMDSVNNSIAASPIMPSINKEIMQPHFMRLYAVVQNSKSNGTLPELDIDETLLSKITYQDIWTLDIPPADKNKISKSDKEDLKIKLALIARKKLWCDMVIETPRKQQPISKNGDNTKLSSTPSKNNAESIHKPEWNSRKHSSIALTKHQFTHIGYEIKGGKKDSKKVTTLLRLKDGPLPWTTHKTAAVSPRSKLNLSCEKEHVIKPFGVLPNNSKTQYVVKGWVDRRFF